MTNFYLRVHWLSHEWIDALWSWSALYECSANISGQIIWSLWSPFMWIQCIILCQIIWSLWSPLCEFSANNPVPNYLNVRQLQWHIALTHNKLEIHIQIIFVSLNWGRPNNLWVNSGSTFYSDFGKLFLLSDRSWLGAGRFDGSICYSLKRDRRC